MALGKALSSAFIRDHFTKRDIIVDGVTITVDTTELRIVELSDDMSKVAAQMAWWASVRAAAIREHGEAEGDYRYWRGGATLALGKMSEWQARAAVEADPDFKKHKNKLARIAEAIDIASGMFEAFAKKANSLQSKGAIVREEGKRYGLSTKTAPATSAEEDESEVEDEPTSGRPLVKPHHDKLR